MKVAWNPQAQDFGVNPYWKLLRTSLEELGVEFDDSPSWSFSRRWLQAKRCEVRILHFHAVRRFWEYELTRARLRWVARFARNLLFAKALGYRVVMTLHDLHPLDRSLQPARVDFLGHWLALNMADAVIVHYESGRRLLARTYGRCRDVHVVRHPNYIGSYPNDVTREEARLHFYYQPDEKVFAFFGGLRPNKGIEDLISAFRRVPRDDLRLLIAGQPWDPPSYVSSLLRQAEADSRVRIVPEVIPDAEVQIYLKAADAVVLPFRDILTSGSTLLAMSFGRPVIASARGCLPDCVPPEAGILYDPSGPDALFHALLEAPTRDLSLMGENAYRAAASSTWEELARITLNVYQNAWAPASIA